MLKIKDHVDLKELENFGFKCYKDIIYKPKHGEWSLIELGVDINTRIIKIAGVPDLFHTVDDTLYDLIKSDLVEKVDDNI